MITSKDSTNSEDIVINGNYIYQEGSNRTAIEIDGANHVAISNNKFKGTGVKIVELNSPNYTTIKDNIFDSTPTLQIMSSVHTIRDNIGFTTESSGSATISNGNTSVTVNHGLAGTPTTINLTGGHSEVKDAYVTNVGSTSFDITVDSAVTADRTVYWYAEYKP